MVVCTHEEGQTCENCEIDSSQDNGDVQCICGSGSKPKSLMKCTGCNKIWHSACVGLAGLTQSITVKIEAWKCPLCFVFSPQIKAKLAEITDSDDEGIKEAGSLEVTHVMSKDIKEIKDILLSKVVPNLANTSTKVSETLDANWRRQSQSWADLVANQKAMEQKISAKQKEEVVLVTNVINSSQQKMERDNIEREKRKRNVVIRELDEPNEGSNEDRRDSDIAAATEILDIDPTDVIQVWRAGPPKRNQNRLLIVTVRTPELAQRLHNYGRGKKVVNLNDDREFYWCNPDLIETDRKANYKARLEARNRRSAQGLGQPRRDGPYHENDQPLPARSRTSSSRQSRSASPQHSPAHDASPPHSPARGVDGRGRARGRGRTGFI